MRPTLLPWKFRLYTADNTMNSAAALANLTALLSQTPLVLAALGMQPALA